ncbi:MAG: hypothetical protein AVDCRST_MAG73-647 [uncultured Thermomicrobiales bacterium]|uniref:HTH luxR-type domain-containing protein n=1 Tax=uncultured Thermomicrobiales bacterium TaxID=1645740 RepID=A0A6J4TMW0_9BACT|nr:MAG: hypothetical protein AVDCRST_MAG73-647 [uncultured Thermomicrobiales bacterium]
MPAIDALGRCLALYRDIGDRLGAGIALDLLGCAEEDRGAYDAAEPLFAEARACFVDLGMGFLVSQVDYHVGVVAFGRGELNLAVERFEEALSLARDEGFPFVAAGTLRYLGLIHLDRGDLIRSAAAIEEALTLDRDTADDDREGISQSLVTLAVLAAAAGLPAASARLRGAADGLREQIALGPYLLPERLAFDHARDAALAALGEPAFAAAWTEGRNRTIEQSEADIAAVLAAARSCPVAANAADPAYGTGITPRELEVLGLIAEGRSNREIAGALFVSPRTVDNHVTNLLAKLDVKSRTAAIAEARRRGIV